MKKLFFNLMRRYSVYLSIIGKSELMKWGYNK